MQVRRRCGYIEATQWNKLGDHHCVVQYTLQDISPGFRPSSASDDPDADSKHIHDICGKPLGEHGFLSHMGKMVCPGDWILESGFVNV